MNQRLQHDAAVVIANACLDVISPVVHLALHAKAWDYFYAIAKAEIEAYEIRVERVQPGLHPSKN